jgi:hypothetical protein
MSEPMTLEEAVRVLREQRDFALDDTQRHPSLAQWFAERTQAIAIVAAHAERTIAARSGEPEAVTRLHATDSSDAREVSIYIDTLNLTCGELMMQRDTLTADRDRLAACVERVVLACRNSFDVRARGKCPDCGELVDQTTQAVGLVRAADILAALEGTND